MIDNVLYFTGFNGEAELWRSDGTAAGTYQVTHLADDVSPGVSQLAVMGGALYFTALDSNHAWALWTSDGTGAGTREIIPFDGKNNENAFNLTAVGDALYFSMYKSVWRSDGTAAGTVRLSDDLLGAGQFTGVGNQVYFFASQYLWKTDGTPGGTSPVVFVNYRDRFPWFIVDVAGTLFFSTGTFLWRYDGTFAGTTEVMRVDNYHFSATQFTPPMVAVLGDKLLFSFVNDSGGREMRVAYARFPAAPKVLSSEFEYAQPIPKLVVRFDSDVSASLTGAHVHLFNLSTGKAVPTAQIVVDYDHANNQAAIGLTGGAFPDGKYQLTLLTQEISGDLGLGLDGDGNGSAGGNYLHGFFQLAGDADRSGDVGFADLVAVAQHYGAAGGAQWSEGDFNGDGKVDFTDLVTVAQRFGKVVVPPAAAASMSTSNARAAVPPATSSAAAAASTAATNVGGAAPPAAPSAGAEPSPAYPRPRPPAQSPFAHRRIAPSRKRADAVFED